MRVQLRDDHRPRPDSAAGVWSIPVALDGDPPGTSCAVGCAPGQGENPPPTGWLPSLEVRERSRAGITEEGVAQYTWQPLHQGPASSMEERQEVNDATGNTMVTAKATMQWPDGKRAPLETAVAWDSRGYLWRISSSALSGGALSLKLERLDSEVRADG